MEWIYAVVYIVIAIAMVFIYGKLFPYEEDITLGYTDSYQRRLYYSMMAVGVVLWPIFLLVFIIRWAFDFVHWLEKKIKTDE